MCQSIAAGGQRCASHTRPAYQTAPFGTPEWDTAAAAYASTPTGRMELMGSLAAAEAAGDVRSIVAFEHALAQGTRLREKAELLREELARHADPEPTPVADPAPPVADEPEEDWGGTSYVEDEDEWETHHSSAWTPTIANGTWHPRDPAFAGCTPQMTVEEFTAL